MADQQYVLPRGGSSNQNPVYEYLFVEAFSRSGGVNTDNNLKTVNDLLAEGWEPVRECPMGGGGENVFVSCLVLLRRKKVG